MRNRVDLPDDVPRGADDGTPESQLLALPLIRSSRQASEDELSPDRIAEILLEGDIQALGLRPPLSVDGA